MVEGREVCFLSLCFGLFVVVVVVVVVFSILLSHELRELHGVL